MRFLLYIILAYTMIACERDYDHELKHFKTYSLSEAIWEGNLWAFNVNFGEWFPTVDDSNSYFGIDDYSISQLHTVDSIPLGTSVRIDVQLFLNTEGVNTDAAFFGFGDQWYSYEGSSYGILCVEGKYIFTQNGVKLDTLGSYTPGDEVSLVFDHDYNGQLRLTINSKIEYSYTPLFSLPIRRFLITSSNAGNGFILKSRLKPSLILYYPFNGSAFDMSGNGNHATVYGAVTSNDRYGSANACYAFDGTNDSIVINDNTIIDDLNNLTIAVWIYYQGGGTNPAILSKSYSSIDLRILQVSDFDKIEAYLNGQGGRTISSVSRNTWTHIAVVKQGNQARIYKDGINIKTFSVTGTIGPSINSLQIGANPTAPNADNFLGKIDDLRIYRRALNDAEVQALFESTN